MKSTLEDKILNVLHQYSAVLHYEGEKEKLAKKICKLVESEIKKTAPETLDNYLFDTGVVCPNCGPDDYCGSCGTLLEVKIEAIEKPKAVL